MKNRDELLYIVSTISLKEKNEDILKKEFEVCKVKYPKWCNSTFEDFCELKKDWNEDKYNLSIEDNAYFLNFNEAKSFIINNTFDINDGGVYNYATIKTVSTKRAYANVYIEELNLFKYNKEYDKYVEVKLDGNDEVKFIIKNIFPLY